ncbi:MAG: DEAD/DEAH box helicase [Polyangiaceae bacterium]|jgi:DEAD/DEAH box helicase domain-containing protein|nr:DEAD/DEAH box helicase [Polyangiaceae bacterium]
MPSPPWKLETGLASVLDRWLADRVVKSCLAADRALAPTEGRFAPIPEDLAPGLVAALRSRNIRSIYSHQREAVDAARRGRHVVVSTPTASGKSLCFHLPVLDALAKDPESTALYLYPTKALSRDQEAGIRELARDAGLSVPAVVYDGDTPGDARRAARERTAVVMTNPDMLHAGILPHHASWSRMFARLKYVVIDELHTYRGVFGSHVAHVLARLCRVAAFHGSRPTFICATATIGNPREHAARLLGVSSEEVELCDQSGAPRGGRHVLLYNPPVVNAELGIRGSYLKAAVRLTADLLRARVPTIVFGPSRNSVEIMLKYLRDALAAELPEDAIMAYRGGYLPDTRRKIERGLREGEILGVVATNALELGIDVGDLDAVVCASYPGTVAGTWQRFGRAGRRNKLSAAILVTASHSIDQYLASNPEFLLDGAIEEARIDPSNTEIVIQHLKCAAFELPFVEREPYATLQAEESGEALRFLAHHGVLHEQSGRFHWATDKYPANHVSLRSVGWDNTVIIDRENGKTLAELDWRATPTMLHEQAIYQHDGEQYQVEELDYDNHKAYVKKVVPDYFTTALTNRKVTPLDASTETKLYGGAGVLGEVSVVEKVVGFKKIKFFTHENAGYGDVRLPDIQMHTTSFWWRVPAGVCLEAGVGRAGALDGLRGILRALETVATIALMCEPRDIGQAIEDGALAGEVGGTGSEFDPTLFLFDNVPGGIGLAARIHEQAPVLLVSVRALLSRCACEHGCPLCVGAVDGLPPIPAAAKAAGVDLALAGSRKRSSMRVLERLMRGDG